MKKLIFVLFVLTETFLAAGQTNLVNWGNNNGTNASSVVTYGNIYFPPQTFTIQFGAITNANPGGSYTTNGMTNFISCDWQFSMDGANSNWITFATMVPTLTNGCYLTFTLPAVSTNLYQRVLVRTTNSLPVGVWKPN